MKPPPFLSSLLLSLLFSHPTYSKTTSGIAKLTGVKTEYLITKFVTSPNSKGKIKVSLDTGKQAYTDERSLRLYIYEDSKWPKVKRAPTCKDKIMYSEQKLDISFKRDARKGWAASISTELNEIGSERPKYWYVTIADCSLEEYFHDNEAPPINFTLRIWDDYIGGSEQWKRKYTHLPHDQQGMMKLHTINVLSSLFLAILIVMKSMYNMTVKAEVHISLLFIFLTCLAHALSSCFEMIHLKRYEDDGIGSYNFDALSAYFEAICDSMIALLLLAVGVGWTLPSDITPQASSSVQGFANNLLVMISNLIKPCTTKQGGTGTRHLHPTMLLWAALISIHTILAIWGRTYSDDFDTYHDLDHWPGKILFCFRITLGVLFLFCTASIRRNAHCSRQLTQFYVLYSVIGGSWFVSLPLLGAFATYVLPVYRRHVIVSGGAALIQACSMACLTWLFMGGCGSAYHKISKVGSGEDGISMNSPAGGASGGKGFWKVGKVKVRTD